MKKVFIKGYIDFESKKYTFTYEYNKLILVCVNNEQTLFEEYQFVEYFDGYTIDGFSISFYINNNIYYKDGCYICSPRCIYIAQNKKYNLSENQFCALSILGESLNRFYSNRNMIEIDFEKMKRKNNFLKFKPIEETVSEEIINLNNTQEKFEFSIVQPGWKDDGNISLNAFKSMLRIKYSSQKNYKLIMEDIISIERFFKFCAYRNNISFDSIYLESKNSNGEYIRMAEVIIPYMVDNNINKYMLTYELLKGHLNNIFSFLENSNYILSVIPDNNKNFRELSNKDYCAIISCFQSIYQFIHTNNDKLKLINDEIELNEVKKELIPKLEELDKEYKGKSKVKRDFIKRFIHIIDSSNLKLEKCINIEIEKNYYIVDTIFYETKNKILQLGIKESIRKAINDRDDITHNQIIKLEDTTIGIYEIISKLNYVMILNYVGIDEEKIKDAISTLSIGNII